MYINSERTHDDACYAELTALSAEELWKGLTLHPFSKDEV